MPNAVDFSLYLITDRKQVQAGFDLPNVIAAALKGGVKAVQLREKDLTAAELLLLAEELRRLTAQYGAKLLINDRIDIARVVDADGVHLGGHSLPTAVARRLLGPDRLIGVSTHALDEVMAAADDGADFVTFGPVFATPSKKAYGPPQGIDALAAVCRQSPLPVFALGGINAQRQASVLQAGAQGIALISAICAAQNPTTAAQHFST